MKSEEALKRIETTFSLNREGKASVYKEYTNGIYPYYEDFDLVMSDLEVLQIIKAKGVDVGFLKTCQTLEEYNCLCWQDEVDVNKKLTEEEFNFLKESLENE